MGNDPALDKTSWSRLTAVRLAVIGVLTLALLIPLAMVDSLVYERKHRRDEAVADITSTWGSAQTIVGPMLVIPYQYSYKAEKEEVINGKVVRHEVIQTAVDTAFFLPSDLSIDGAMSPERLHRGIYEAVVYRGRLTLSGRFPTPDWRALKIDPKGVLWSDAKLTLAIPDLRGTREALALQFGGHSFVMLPGTKVPGYASGAHVLVGETAAREKLEFSLALDLNGSSSISFAPLGVKNTVSLRSTWPDPKFQGSFLPTNRQVTKNGFTARWDVSYYGRNYPQLSTERGGGKPDAAAVNPSLFGVAFLSSIDSYRNVERSIKYAVLFIALVFTAFFLFEVLAFLRIHPVQYLLVGLALSLFFLVLLSLSEFLAFWAAYLVAASLAVSMIVLYCSRFLGSGRPTAILATQLFGVYAYLYVVLQRQDFSLLLGSLLLVGALGALMYLTRDINWYALDKQTAAG